MKIEAVIFDWDGVLNNSVHAVYEAYLVTLEKLKLPKITFSQFQELWESDYRKFETKVGLTKDKRPISDKVWYNSIAKLMKKMDLFPGAKDFLTKVKKNFKIGLVTNEFLKRMRREINHYGLENIFDSIVTADDVKNLKPDPEVLLICASKLKVDPKECVYVGDMKGDILAARNAGMISIAVTWGYHDISFLEEANPEHVAKDFNELYNIIKVL